jgi:hypothetical protein
MIHTKNEDEQLSMNLEAQATRALVMGTLCCVVLWIQLQLTLLSGI